MLIYHPIGDANHCAYRIISLLLNAQEHKMSLIALRFADYYYLFPNELKNIDKWPKKNTKYANAIESLNKPYEQLTNPKRIFYELENTQNNTLTFLLSKGILSKNDYENKIIKLILEAIPQNLKNVIENDPFKKTLIFELLSNVLPLENMIGKNGMKNKTGLMEYLYD